jgi:imidazolonepropionase-like amidohydrolase
VDAWHVRGVVLPAGTEHDLYAVAGRLTFTPVEGATTLATDVYLLPGLVDMHAHLALASPAGDQVPLAERVRASAQVHLDAGVLALREPGSSDHTSVGLGPAKGLPRVSTAGRFLAPPGRYFPGLAREVPDGELPLAALEELQVSGDWVKLIGDSPIPGPGITRTFGEAAVAAAVLNVHDAGGRVAVHCALPEVIAGALQAGVDTLEHATFLQPDQVPALAASGAAWVPTCTINEGVKAMLPQPMAQAVDRQAVAICAAEEAGVPVLAGTDGGLGPHGRVRGEMELLAEAGLPPTAALAAGSWAARPLLRLPGLEEGAPADLTAYAHDPRAGLDALADPVVVLLDGRLVPRR